MIKRLFLIIASVCMVLLSLVSVAGCAGSTRSEKEPIADAIDYKLFDDSDLYADSVNISLEPFLNLFMGMQYDADGRYNGSLSDSIKGIVHYEFSDTWMYVPDSNSFQISVGLYLDNEYPSDIIRQSVLRKINAAMPAAFEYDADSRQVSLLKDKIVKTSQDVEAFVLDWRKVFYHLSALNKLNAPSSDFPKIAPTRASFVCHKIYENSKVATYMLQQYLDFHESSGCSSFADYFSYDKNTGKELTPDQLIAHYYDTSMIDSLKIAYREELLKRGYKSEDINDDDIDPDFLKKLDGVAVVSHALLLYCHPYKLGFGADGQFNFIIPVENK